MDLIKQSSFVEEKISHINLNASVLKDKEFENCTFERCSFVNVIFDNCKFIECKFIECVLSAIKPNNNSFVDITFQDSKVIGVDWTIAKNIRSLSFMKSQLDYSNFSYLKLPKMKLTNCIVHDVDFTETDLTEGDFSGSDFEKTIFSNTNLTKVDFRRASNYAIDFRYNILKKAQFTLPEAANLLNSLDILLEY